MAHVRCLTLDALNHDPAPVARVWHARHEAGFLQAVDHAGDRSGAKPGDFRQTPRGDRTGLVADQVGALVVGRIETEAICNSRMEHYSARGRASAFVKHPD